MIKCEIKINLESEGYGSDVKISTDINGEYYLPAALRALMDAMKVLANNPESDESIKFSALVSDLSYDLLTRTDEILEEDNNNE